MEKQFTIEDLENIRILLGQKTKQITNNITNFQSKTDLKPEVQQKRIDEARQEFATYSLIEAKCMSQQSEMMFNSLENYEQKT